MGLFDKITKIMGAVDKIENFIGNLDEKNDAKSSDMKNDNVKKQEEIVLSSSSHIVEEIEYGDNDSQYRVSFEINDAFKEAKSHAAEVSMLHTYSPNEEYGEEGKVPYIAIQNDDDVYCPVEEYKEKGTVSGVVDLTPLNGKFHFKAKKEYYGDMMYFYGMDRLDGFWENNGLCLVYPKSYVGTENEAKLMSVLDKMAESYDEKKIV